MGNIDNKKIIRIYGVTLSSDGGIRPYGHGMEQINLEGKEVFIEYVDYLIEDLVNLIKNQNKEKEIIKKLNKRGIEN